jgi:hypothetical protein
MRESFDIYILDKIWDLILAIDEAIRNIKQKNRTNLNDWNRPEAWSNIAYQLEWVTFIYLNKPLEMCEFLVGLSKWFDYFSLDWTVPRDRYKINSLVNVIVSRSLKAITRFSSVTIQQPLSCGQHADGACVISKMTNRCSSQINHPLGYRLSLPKKEAANFKNKPRPIPMLIRGDTTVYRVIGNNNRPDGLYWLRHLPQTLAEWRSSAAVLKSWNLDKYYVELILPKNTIVWCGLAASQKVKYAKCILIGGGDQLWLPPIIMRSLRRAISQKKLTSW